MNAAGVRRDQRAFSPRSQGQPLSVTLSFGLQSAEPRDQRVVEEGLHPSGIDGVSGEGLGGYVDTLGGGFEAPLVGARDALRFATHKVRERSSTS